MDDAFSAAWKHDLDDVTHDFFFVPPHDVAVVESELEDKVEDLIDVLSNVARQNPMLTPEETSEDTGADDASTQAGRRTPCDDDDMFRPPSRPRRASRAHEKETRHFHTDASDARLLDFVRQEGCKWRLASRTLGVLSDDAWRQRFVRIADKHGLSHLLCKQGNVFRRQGSTHRWSAAQDKRLLKMVMRHGQAWGRIRNEAFPNATRQAIRQRAWRLLNPL
jgi:hypothetical protein